MASVPKFKLNTGAEIPAVGELRRRLQFTERANVDLSGMGCWAGFSEEEAEGAVSWFLSALKVSRSRSPE